MFADRRHSLLIAAVLLLAAGQFSSREAYGQVVGVGGPGGGGQQQLATARSNLAYAQANVDRLKDRAERSLAHDKNWAAAKAAVTQAEKNRDAVRDQAKEQVMAKPEYQAMAREMEGSVPDGQKADDRAKMAAMIWDAQQNSPECAAAQTTLNDAKAELGARWKDYETRVLANDPEWTSAVAARDAARAQVSASLEAQKATGGAQHSSMGRTSGSSSSRGSSGRSSSGSSRSRSY